MTKPFIDRTKASSIITQYNTMVYQLDRWSMMKKYKVHTNYNIEKAESFNKQSINNHLDLDHLKGSSILDKGHMNQYKDKVQLFLKKIYQVCVKKMSQISKSNKTHTRIRNLSHKHLI